MGCAINVIRCVNSVRIRKKYTRHNLKNVTNNVQEELCQKNETKSVTRAYNNRIGITAVFFPRSNDGICTILCAMNGSQELHENEWHTQFCFFLVLFFSIFVCSLFVFLGRISFQYSKVLIKVRRRWFKWQNSSTSRFYWIVYDATKCNLFGISTWNITCCQVCGINRFYCAWYNQSILTCKILVQFVT